MDLKDNMLCRIDQLLEKPHTAYGGKTWTTQPTSTNSNLLDIYVRKNRSWVVGSGGAILRRG